MKKLSLFSLMLMAASMFLFLGGCQREDILLFDNLQHKDKNLRYLFKKDVNLDTFPEMKRHIEKHIRSFSTRNATWTVENINFKNAQFIQIDETSSTTTVEISHKIPNSIYNLIVNEINGVKQEPFIIEYRMHEDFVGGYVSGTLAMTDFKGTITQYPTSSFFNNQPRSSFDCKKAANCMTIYINLLKRKSGNGDGSGNSGSAGDGSGGASAGDGTMFGDGVWFGGNGQSGTIGNPLGGSNGGVNIWHGGNGGGSSSTGSNGGSSGTSGSGGAPASGGGGTGDNGATEDCEENEEAVLIETLNRVICILSLSNQNFKQDDNTGSRNDSEEKCSKMLKVLGFVSGEGSVIADPTATCLENCRKENPDVVKELEKLGKSEIYTCDKNFKMGVSDIETALCMSGNFNLKSLENLMDNIYKDLEGVDYIITSSDFSNCKFYNCIFDELVKHSDKENCRSFFNVLSNKNIKTTLKTGNSISGMQTTLSDDKKSIIITVNDDFCDKNFTWYNDKASEVLGAGQLLHEFVHAEWLQKILISGKNPSKIGSYTDLWPDYKNYLIEVYDYTGSIESVHHAIMIHLEDTIKTIATDLFKLFDGASYGLTVDHFMMAGANGLFDFMDSNTKAIFLKKYQEKSIQMNNLSPQLSINCK